MDNLTSEDGMRDTRADQVSRKSSSLPCHHHKTRAFNKNQLENLAIYFMPLIEGRESFIVL